MDDLYPDPVSFVARHSRDEVVKLLDKSKDGVISGVRSEDDHKEYLASIWREWARFKRPQRTLELFLELVKRSARGQTMGYDEVYNYIDNEAHYERAIILSKICGICQNNKWPPYVSIVINKDGDCGYGFYSQYGIAGQRDAMADVGQSMRDLCFRSKGPDYPEIIAGFAPKGKVLVEAKLDDEIPF